MALQFQPPPDWLINDYMTRKSPGQQASDSINQALQSYTALKQQQAAQKQGQVKTYIDAMGAGGPKFASDVASQIGLQNPPTVPQAQPPTVSTAPVQGSMMPTATEEAAQQSIQGEHPQAPLSPIVQASLAAGHPNHAGLQLPGTENPEDLLNQGAYGMKRLAARESLQKLTDAQAVAEDKRKPVPVMTKEDAIKAKTVDPNTKIVEPPAPRLDLSTKQDQFDQKEWDKIVKDTNPLTASSRTTLGMASKANFQADRALVTLSKPVVTVQEAGNVMADIAAIYQTGSPTQYGMSHQEYSTLYGKIQAALGTVTGKPQDALPDAIKKRLVGVLHDMKQTNGLVLKQQLDFTEKSKKRIIDKFPDEWKGIRSTLETNPDQGFDIPQTGPHGASISQNGFTYSWNPRTGQYE